MNELTNLKEIAERIIETKEAIYDLQMNLKELEIQAIAIVGHNTEGSRAVQLDGMSVQTVGKVTRTLDRKKLKEIWNNIPEPIRKNVVKFEPKLDLRQYRKLRQVDDHAWFELNKAIISKPAKTSVNIKLFEKEK